jgi:hypothetical protein
MGDSVIAEPPIAPTKLLWSQALPGAALSGAVLAIALAVPLASPLLVMLIAGALSQAMYARRTGAVVSPATGARAGILGGLFGWGLVAAALAFQLAFGGGRLIETLREAMQQQIAASPDPHAQEIMARLTASTNGMITVVLFGLLLFLVLAVAASAAGGALGARLFGGKK